MNSPSSSCSIKINDCNQDHNEDNNLIRSGSQSTNEGKVVRNDKESIKESSSLHHLHSKCDSSLTTDCNQENNCSDFNQQKTHQGSINQQTNCKDNNQGSINQQTNYKDNNPCICGIEVRRLSLQESRPIQGQGNNGRRHSLIGNRSNYTGTNYTGTNYTGTNYTGTNYTGTNYTGLITTQELITRKKKMILMKIFLIMILI